MLSKYKLFLGSQLTLLLLILMLVACNKPAPATTEAAKVTPPSVASTLITFVTMNSPNTYFVNNDKEFAGLEYDLAKQFILRLNKHAKTPYQMKFTVVHSIEEVMNTLESGKADIAAADLTVTDARKKIIDFSIPYQDVQQQLVFNKQMKSKPPKNAKELVNVHLVVPAASSFVERLTHLQQKEPGIIWEERQAVHSENLLEDVAAGDIDYTIADSHLVSVLQNYHPNLGVAFALGEPEKIAWGFAKSDKKDLVSKANTFFADIKKDGTLRNLIDRYHGNAKRLNPTDIKTFLIRKNTLLPKYKRLFHQAQEISGLDWRLLAAISYQESHWDTFNTSPTNVRGLMMLTEATSDQMGVTNRLDPKQSIPAGAKYVTQLIETMPNRIAEPDRTYMALAAYNIGYAHVEDARVLAQRLKMNPDRWADVKKTLVMLNDQRYYANAKYGYCSGGAPVIYVESIRSYYNILERYEPAHQPNESDPYKIASNTTFDNLTAPL